jgi:hypothetical protein
VIPDDTGKDLVAVLSYLVGRPLSKEEVWKAMKLPRSTYYDQLEKGTLISSDNLGKAAANLGINRAELLTRYRFIDPEEITALAAEMHRRPTATATAEPEENQQAAVLEMRPRSEVPPL